jgi:uncharacterized membrane protein YgcG
MSEKLFDALEICLQAIEQGETINAALGRFPALAGELRPMLEASLHAQALAGAAVPSDAQRRGRARLLQRAAEMREAKRTPRRTWVFSLRPVAVTLFVVIFFLSSTGLVRASSGTIPGDNLYPVKRTWEDVTLIFASNSQSRETLQLTYETERVDEIGELLAKGRTEPVSFSGYVTAQTNDQWTVAGIPVIINSDTKLPATAIAVGAAVMVTGTTDSHGFLVAQSIETVAPGTIVPEIDSDDHEQNPNGTVNGNSENSNSSGEGVETESGSSSGNDAGGSVGQGTREPTSKLEGILQNMNGNVWTVDGKTVDVSTAEIVGTAVPGATVIVEGYYNSDGVFIATRVTFGDSINGNGNGSGDSNSNEGSNTNGDDKGGGGGGEGNDNHFIGGD